jgi:histone-lysine N-methyltransferase SETDB1
LNGGDVEVLSDELDTTSTDDEMTGTEKPDRPFVASVAVPTSDSTDRQTRSRNKDKKVTTSAVDQPGNAPVPEDKPKHISTRKLFGKDEDVYIMDAKEIGNIGRYLNHSCGPNVFVQNCFVDTHDLRFPWVSFFAQCHISAGQELCWDYAYIVDQVAGKEIYCECGAEGCRGRLL